MLFFPYFSYRYSKSQPAVVYIPRPVGSWNSGKKNKVYIPRPVGSWNSGKKNKEKITFNTSNNNIQHLDSRYFYL